MKKIIIIVALMLLGNGETYSQSMSCQELFEIVTSKYDSKENVTCYGSTMLVKVENYKIENKNFVVAYIKSNDYDYKGKPYLFCGIPSMNWSYFKFNSKNSWGESFHEYIRDYTCNCN